MSMALSASATCVSCISASGAPNRLRVAARSIISSKARRAKPSAAAATVERKISSVAMATLKPSPGTAEPVGERHAAAGETQRRQRMRRDDLDTAGDLQAWRVGVDDEGGQPLGARRFAAAREHHVVIGDAAVGNPGLQAVDAICAVRPSPRSSPAR